jgi:putative endonuclease
MHYVYVLQNVTDDSDFYLGCTSDLRKRFASHNKGESLATKQHHWKVVYYEAYVTLSAARKREYHLKHDGRAKRFLMERIRDSLE